jgi:preprotein translocase subunit YajC
MTGFINLLLESPLLLFLILAAIFSFIQSRNSSKQEESRERPRPQQQEQGEHSVLPGKAVLT